MILMILGTLLGVGFSPRGRIEITLWRHMVEDGACGSKIVPRAPKIVPSGPTMKPQLSPKSYTYHRNMILTPSGTVAVLGAHATVDIYIMSDEGWVLTTSQFKPIFFASSLRLGIKPKTPIEPVIV